jgi:hypothetical protein
MDTQKRPTEEDEVCNSLVSQSLMRQKDEIQTFLSPNYFPRLAEEGASKNQYKSIDVGSLEERSVFLM